MTTDWKKTEPTPRATTERCCPTCTRSFDGGAAGQRPPGYPFCSERCRLIDLGRWLDEDFKIPTDERQ
jgi:endogenous inhibitor of DNA gyrase (YacG/DUF329 family)